jgi:hypothetical protein
MDGRTDKQMSYWQIMSILALGFRITISNILSGSKSEWTGLFMSLFNLARLFPSLAFSSFGLVLPSKKQ